MLLRTRRKNACPATALHDIHKSCQNRTVEGAPLCTVGHSAFSAYTPDLLPKVGISKSRDIGPMRSCSCLVVLSVSSATLAREAFFCQSFRLESNTELLPLLLQLQKPSSLFISPLTVWRSHEPASGFYCCCWRCRGPVSCGEVLEDL